MTLPTDSYNQSEGSQLSLFNRIKLLIKNPKDAFSLFSFKERRGAAFIIFFSYFLIKFPIVLQRPYIEGKFDEIGGASPLVYFAGGFIGGIFITLVLFLLTKVSEFKKGLKKQTSH